MVVGAARGGALGRCPAGFGFGICPSRSVSACGAARAPAVTPRRGVAFELAIHALAHPICEIQANALLASEHLHEEAASHARGRRFETRRARCPPADANGRESGVRSRRLLHPRCERGANGWEVARSARDGVHPRLVGRSPSGGHHRGSAEIVEGATTRWCSPGCCAMIRTCSRAHPFRAAGARSPGAPATSSRSPENPRPVSERFPQPMRWTPPVPPRSRPVIHRAGGAGAERERTRQSRGRSPERSLGAIGTLTSYFSP
jgi:hypothetical protein